ncbi:MAG: hypothetical protein ACFFEN_01265 [Candidatus Thorarchaeota archaeon]
MKVEYIAVNLLARTMTHAKSTGVETTKYEKKSFSTNILAYIEDYITKNGFDIINVYGDNLMFYHLIKRE